MKKRNRVEKTSLNHASAIPVHHAEQYPKFRTVPHIAIRPTGHVPCNSSAVPMPSGGRRPPALSQRRAVRHRCGHCAAAARFRSRSTLRGCRRRRAPQMRGRWDPPCRRARCGFRPPSVRSRRRWSSRTGSRNSAAPSASTVTTTVCQRRPRVRMRTGRHRTRSRRPRREHGGTASNGSGRTTWSAV